MPGETPGKIKSAKKKNGMKHTDSEVMEAGKGKQGGSGKVG
eukprot:CAMPEP_0177728836 /NCGR_PEP_ID=MMETSP0484_2-20121128/21099_1 /TAXON_ID=354590 /ORGANISM="Rhodomonas lens, Strain RHODO" /LENGTH=40 /DNA_ID= /DNA_START= /DNA_END= /DNA_ORIENTATION=